jgi:hypothetical protein
MRVGENNFPVLSLLKVKLITLIYWLFLIAEGMRRFSALQDKHLKRAL